MVGENSTFFFILNGVKDDIDYMNNERFKFIESILARDIKKVQNIKLEAYLASST